MKPLSQKLVLAALFLGAFLIFPSISFACHRTNINFPAEGQNLDFSQLPAFISARYDTSPGPGIKNYYLDLYFGVPGNAQVISGGFQGGFSSCVDDREAQGSRLDKAGDYFYVLYDVNQVEQAGGGLVRWISYWETGAAFPWPPIPIDYAVSGFSVNKEVKLDPVIIIPGILGSEEKNGELILQPRLRIYDGLKQTLIANGYIEGKTEFDFPYNWRQSNVITAQQLRDKINEIKTICECGKVDVIAHSMGGLVARQYVHSDLYQGDVDQLIFLGTPHLGAPKAYFAWEGGTAEVRLSIEDLLLNALLRQEAIEAGFGNVSNPRQILFNYIHNPDSPILSFQELLPIYSYLKDFDTDVLREYPNGHPQNIFLENLGMVSFLAGQAGINITNIFSDDQNDTVSFIKVQNDTSTLPLWEHGIPKEIEKGAGDKTVPVISSMASITSTSTAPNNVTFLNLNIGGEHRDLPANAADEIVEILTGQPPKTVVTISPIKRFLSIFGLSPIDMLITAPDGKRIGKDFSTGQEVNEIAGAFYSGFNTLNENIFIPEPLDGEYVITTQGTGDGTYEVLADYIREEISGEAISTTASFAANTVNGLVSELNLSVDSSNPQNMDIQPADITPPEISIISPEARDYLRSETLPVNIVITDSESGVLSSEIKFDDRIISSASTVDLFFEKLGTHKITANAVDFVGNAANKEVSFRIVATIPSTISDIERAYTLGWINKKSVKNTLIKKLKNIANHNRDITHKTLKTFLAELEREHPKHINDQAYNLLKEDINWLLNN